jgi:phosphoglycolate phosphatase-like HAD superfamily hydrolase
MNVTPPDFVYIGDTHLDVQSAQAAGARCWAVTTGYASRDTLTSAGADKIFDNMTDAAKSVRKARQFTS